MQELYYARHGVTYDLAHHIRSRPNTPLTDEGQAQMQRAGKLLVTRGIRPSLIICSKLPRAIHSAQIVTDEVGYRKDRILRKSLLNERDCGEAMGVQQTEIKKRWPEGLDTVPGVETIEQLQQRAAKAKKWLQQLDAEIILIVGHGTFGRATIREFEGRPHTDEYAANQVRFGRGQAIRLYPSPTIALTP